MPIQLNTDFRKFVGFANGNGVDGKDVATVYGVEEKMDVRQRAGDRVSVTAAIFRDELTRSVNRHTRDVFRNAVADMFGGEDRIPASVKTAMKLDDYDGKGKPLSARRIRAVHSAIAGLDAKYDAAVGLAKRNAANLYAQAEAGRLFKVDGSGKDVVKATAADVDAQIERMVLACLGDDDALAVVAEASESFASWRPDGLGGPLLRGAKDLKASMDMLRGNTAAMRAVANGNARAMAVMKAFAVKIGYPVMEADAYSMIFSSISKSAAQTVAKIAGASSAAEFSEAIREFHGFVAAHTLPVKGDPKAEALLADLTAGLVLAQADEATARRLRQVLYSDIANTVEGLYEKAASGNAGEIPENAAPGAKRLCGILCGTLDRLRRMTGAMPGEEPVRKEPAEAAAQDARAVYAGIQAAVKIETEIEAAAKADAFPYVTGNGAQAKTMRRCYARRLANESSLASGMAKFQDAVRKKLAVELNGQICKEAKILATVGGMHSLFAKDNARGTIVRLPGGKTLTNGLMFTERGQEPTLSVAQARDELASFVTGGAVAKYDALGKTEKTKVHIIMGVLTQGSPINFISTHQIALDPDNDRGVYNPIGEKDGPDYDISFGDDGSLKISMDFRYTGIWKIQNAVTDPEWGLKEEDVDLDADKSRIEYRFTLEIDAKTLDKMSKCDFAAYGDAPAEAAPKGSGSQPMAAEKIPQPFRFADDFKLTCSVAMHFD